MAYRDYIQPKIPSDWRGAERTYAIMLQNVLDDLHMPVQESWLSTSLLKKLEGGAGSSSGSSYSEEIAETGLVWIDGSPIKRVTQEIEVEADVAADSEAIDGLVSIIRAEGFVQTSAGACYPVGADVTVWKPSNSNKFKVLSTVNGTAYITIWFIEGEAPVVTDTFIFFNDGYTEYEGGGQIEWGANQLTRPNDGIHGYTVYGLATLNEVETNGRMLLYNATGSDVYYNSHVCTANLIHIPASASKLVVKIARGPNSAQANIALLPNDAPNSMDTSEGGKISTFYTLTTTPTDYTLDLDSSMLGSDDYRIVINFRGKSDVYRAVFITKVSFE